MAKYVIGLKLSERAKRNIKAELTKMGYKGAGKGSSPQEEYIILSKPLTPDDEAALKSKMWDLLISVTNVG